tara:strand:- start:60 stop:398 length:339 start_codon:yes stop_codon:yes gene_type:complete
MEKLTLIIHILTGIAIVGMILLQQGKGAEAGASFGSGASQTMLGSAGSWNFFSKITAILATIFFITSFGLAVIAKDRATVIDEIFPSLDSIEQSLETELPEIDSIQESSDLK